MARYWQWLQLPLILASSVWLAQAQDIDCPGYMASAVTTTDNGLTARLTLAGPACHSYGIDLEDLLLLVEYQTGTVKIYQPWPTRFHLF